MTDEQRLSEALHEIVPAPPERPERGPAVEERVRRHRRRTDAATVLVAAAVMVAAAVAVPAALSQPDTTSPETTSSTATAPELTCPDLQPASVGPGTLPAGATAVRLCTEQSILLDAPADILTTDVDRLVDLVNEQPEADPAAVCTQELGRSYVLAFAYPDGEVRRAVGQLYGCHELRVGSITRTGAETPYRQFMRSLRDQRALDDLPTPPVDADASAAEVVASYVDRLNAGDRAGAAALWISLVPVRLPAGHTRIDYELEDVRPLRKVSAYREATAVTALYREVIRDAHAPYREAVFTLGRDEQGAFRIVGVNVGEVIETGR